MTDGINRKSDGAIEAIAAAVPTLEEQIRMQFPDIDLRHRPLGGDAADKATVSELVDILEFFLVATDPLLDATSVDGYSEAVHYAVANRAREAVAAFRATRVGGKGGTGGTAGSGR